MSPSPSLYGANYARGSLPTSGGSLFGSLLGGGSGGLLQNLIGGLAGLFGLGSSGGGSQGIGALLSSLLGSLGGGGGGGGGGGFASLLGGLGGGSVGGGSSPLAGLFGGGGGSQGGSSGSISYGGIGVDVGGIAKSISSIAVGQHISTDPNYKSYLTQERYKLGIMPSFEMNIRPKIKTLLASGIVSPTTITSILNYLPQQLYDEGQQAFVTGALALSGKQLNKAMSLTGGPTLPIAPAPVGSALWNLQRNAAFMAMNPQTIGGY